jgi:hypothetical protein
MAPISANQGGLGETSHALAESAVREHHLGSKKGVAALFQKARADRSRNTVLKEPWISSSRKFSQGQKNISRVRQYADLASWQYQLQSESDPERNGDQTNGRGAEDNSKCGGHVSVMCFRGYEAKDRCLNHRHAL